MTTLQFTAPSAPQVWNIPGLSRIGAYLSFVAEVYGEALHEMRVANRKYPFAGV